MTTLSDILTSGAFGAIAGAFSGFLGIGGGALLPPLLVLALHTPLHRAQGISLAALLPPVALPALISYRRSGVAIDHFLVIALVVGFVCGGVGGALVAHHVPARELRLLFAGFLVVSAIRAFVDVRNLPTESPWENTVVTNQQRLFGLPIGVAAGFTSGLLGVGGGLVALPLLKRFTGLSRLQSQATMLAMALPPIGLPAVFIYAKADGGFSWALLISVAVGFSIGTALGALGVKRSTPKAAMRLYACFLVVTAALLVWRA